MIDNYNVIELLEVYVSNDDIIKDIINDIQNNGSIAGVKIS